MNLGHVTVHDSVAAWHISLKKKESNKENIGWKREKLVTLIMNKLILNDNNPIRDCQSGFFQQVRLACMSFAELKI